MKGNNGVEVNIRGGKMKDKKHREQLGRGRRKRKRQEERRQEAAGDR